MYEKHYRNTLLFKESLNSAASHLHRRKDSNYCSKSDNIETLEQQLREEVKERSLLLTHLARNEYNTKELIRLELEHEQLQQSNISQQQRLSNLRTQSLLGVTNNFYGTNKCSSRKVRQLQAQHDSLDKKNEPKKHCLHAKTM